MNVVQVNDPRFPSHLEVSGDMLYCVDGVSDTIVLIDWLLWTIVVSQCPSLLLSGPNPPATIRCVLLVVTAGKL